MNTATEAIKAKIIPLIERAGGVKTVARMSGVPFKTIYRYVNNETSMSSLQLAMICDVLGLELTVVRRKKRATARERR